MNFNLVDMSFVFAFLCLLVAVYTWLHMRDIKKGDSIAFVEELLQDGSWRMHELVVHPSGHVRMLSLVWNKDVTAFSRHRILAVTPKGDRRQALDAIVASTGKTLRFY